MRPLAALLLLLLANAAFADAPSAIHAAAELYRAVYETSSIGTSFDVTVVATTPAKSGPHVRFACEDDTGATVLTKERDELAPISVKAGEIIRVTGRIEASPRSKSAYADCRTIEHVGERSVRMPISVPIAELLSGKHDCRPAIISGMIRDVFRDEIDPEYLYAILIAEKRFLYVPFKTQEVTYDEFSKLVGAEVSITGISIPVEFAARRRIGRTFQPANGMESLHIVQKALSNPFESSPRLIDIKRLSPQDVALLNRHRAAGRVIARWGGNRLLLKSDEGDVIGVTLTDGPKPAYGETIEVVGFPESDLYRLNLTRAAWRPATQSTPCDEMPRTISTPSFMSDVRGRHRYDPYAHGQVLRLQGKVVSLPSVGNNDGRLSLQDGDYLVPIDFSANPDALKGIEVGCSLGVTGTCIMESENWQPHSAFPRIRGFALVVRTPADVRILARPPWWTVRKLFAVIGSMLALLAAIVVWNLMLRRVAERRGRQLLKAQIAQMTASLKVEERTRLAVELHDAISQTLTGASMRIDAARKLLDRDREKTARQLDIASNTLDSCREELKNCIWDLRNEALDERDLNEAIRLTLVRGIGEAKLTVRFNIPRTRLSDNTTNAILCIIRELAVNAVRHGRATELRIAGSIEDANLLFSVRDNGSGFSPDEAPGVSQGHFGLQGIRERLKRLNGSLVFSRPSEGGTRAVVRIRNTLIHEEKVSS